MGDSDDQMEMFLSRREMTLPLHVLEDFKALQRVLGSVELTYDTASKCMERLENHVDVLRKKAEQIKMEEDTDPHDFKSHYAMASKLQSGIAKSLSEQLGLFGNEEAGGGVHAGMKKKFHNILRNVDALNAAVGATGLDLTFPTIVVVGAQSSGK